MELMHIYFVCQKHFKKNDAVINISEYTWFGNKRTILHHRAKSGSGGCGILIKNQIFSDFNVEIIIHNMEGLLGLKLVEKV